MKTYSAKPEEVKRGWVLIDAEDQVLGRLATKVADILRGKNKATYTPHVDTGDFVVIINAEKIKLTGNKLDQKRYYHYTGYSGGMKSKSARELLNETPEQIIVEAVKGMLPKNRLNRRVLTKLKVYAGPEHPHQAQQPKTVTA